MSGGDGGVDGGGDDPDSDRSHSGSFRVASLYLLSLSSLKKGGGDGGDEMQHSLYGDSFFFS